MALPPHLKQNLMPSEISFLAENEPIQILPRYSMKSIQLTGVCITIEEAIKDGCVIDSSQTIHFSILTTEQTKVPTLRALKREHIPLWVALILKSQGKCNIVPPKWLTVSYLKEKYEEELANPMSFSGLPWNWIELSKILLSKAPDDLADPVHQLRSSIQDLKEVRQAKSRKGLKEVNESNIGLAGLSLLEINELRPFMLGVMNKLREIHDTIEEDGPVDVEEDDYDQDD